VALGAVAYWPVTGGFFHADDFLLLYAVAEGRGGELLLTPHAGHLLLLRNAVFLAQHALFGAAPGGYFATAYLTHLLNIALLFAVIRRASGAPRLAGVGAALWGVSPLHAEALGWYSVYGEVLLTACLLGALLCLLRLEDGVASPRAGGWAALLLLAGALCFGTGIGLGIAAGLVVAVGLLVPGAAGRRTRRWCWLLAVGLPLLYAGLQVAYALVSGQRHQSAAPAIDIRQLLLGAPLMTATLLAYGSGSLVGGAAIAGRSLPIVLIAGAAALAAAALLGLRRDPTGRRLAACGLIVIAAYGIVAVGRVPTLAELGLTIAQGAAWPRYHYAPTVLIAVALCLALSRIRLPAIAADGAALAATAAIAAGSILLPPAIDLHADARATVERVRAVVARNAAAAPGDTAYVHNRNLYPLNYLLTRQDFAGWAALYVIFFPTNTVGDVRLRFVDTDPQAVAAARARSGSRLAELLMTRGEFRQVTGQPAARGGG
jgi:hypothetical protein